jgi:hypothetical protein
MLLRLIEALQGINTRLLPFKLSQKSGAGSDHSDFLIQSCILASYPNKGRLEDLGFSWYVTRAQIPCTSLKYAYINVPVISM